MVKWNSRNWLYWLPMLVLPITSGALGLLVFSWTSSSREVGDTQVILSPQKVRVCGFAISAISYEETAIFNTATADNSAQFFYIIHTHKLIPSLKSADTKQGNLLLCETTCDGLQSVQEGRSAPVSGLVAENHPCQTTVAFPAGHNERVKRQNNKH